MTRKRLRSTYFIATGALGGLCGFLLMETIFGLEMDGGPGGLRRMAAYFAGFGLSVGAFLGLTEGLVRRRYRRLVYGLVVGGALGGLGGALGGALGQSLFSLLPIRYATQSSTDLAVVLDSSGSMKKLFFWGNDPWGKRKDAARRLIQRLASTDRVAVIDFDRSAKLLHPLGSLDSSAERRAAARAVDRVDSAGGTDLTAGLSLAVQVLGADTAPGRDRFAIFLTDGVGRFDPAVVERARESSIAIHTVGLGRGVDAGLLEHAIARPTGGTYFAVQNAGDLLEVFERIYTERIDMASRAPGGPTPRAELVTSPVLILVFRIGSWALMGLVVGLGQGIRENTKEDLLACGLGGFLGGLIGGASFEGVSTVTDLAGGPWSRVLADTFVGALIGGSLRITQERLVGDTAKTTRLSILLPGKDEPGLTERETPGVVLLSGEKGFTADRDA